MHHEQTLAKTLFTLALLLVLAPALAGNAKAADVNAGTWNELYNALQTDGNNITLTADVTFGDPGKTTGTHSNSALEVPSGSTVTTVTLNLNGHTIDRGLGNTSVINDGFVIKVFGSLTLNDSSGNNSGTITGGNTNGKGGGIWCIGSVTMNGGTITGNRANYGGGVYIGSGGSGGTFTMTGGIITGNSCVGDNYGGGVYIGSGGTFQVSGSPVITGNTRGGEQNNVLFYNPNGTITLVGDMTAAARISVSPNMTSLTNVSLADRILPGNHTVPDSAFFTDAPSTVTFNRNGGSGTMGNQSIPNNTPTVLNPNAFSRTGYTFTGWNTVQNPTTSNPGTDYADTANITLYASLTLYALWTPISYAITYDLAGGSVTPANPATYTVETPAFTLENPTWDGYRFMGWTGTDLSSAATSVTVAAHSTGARSYTATWAQLYGVTVENGTADATDAAENDVVTITADAAPAGKLFDKWTSADGVVFVDENAETTTFSMPAQAVTVTANYKNVPPAPAPLPSGGGNSAPAEPFKQKFESPLVFDGGKIYVDPTEAGIGDTVTLTVTPDAGKQLEQLIIDRVGGEPLPYEDKGGGVYTFTMPGWRIEIKAMFESETADTPQPGAAAQDPLAPQPVPPGNLTGVVLSPQHITVNGEEMTVEAYNIGGTNYFKLRDLAAMLRGTRAQFAVAFDQPRDTVVVATGQTYDGGVNTAFVNNAHRAVNSYQSVEIDSSRVSLTAYNIGGNNFFGLRELAPYFGYGADYDEATNTAIIESR